MLASAAAEAPPGTASFSGDFPSSFRTTGLCLGFLFLFSMIVATCSRPCSHTLFSIFGFLYAACSARHELSHKLFQNMCSWMGHAVTVRGSKGSSLCS